MNNQDAILTEWAAAAIHGLWTDWPDTAATVLYANRGAKGSSRTSTALRTPLRPVFRRKPPNVQVTTPDPAMPTMQVVDQATAAAQCLHSIIDGRHSWRHPSLPGMDNRTYRAIQFVDAFAQCTWLSFNDIRRSTRGLIARETVERILSLSDLGAQSPMETTLRLLVQDLLPPGYMWESQITTDAGGRSLPGGTIPDLACRGLRIALYFDGGHHDSLHQRERDLRLTRYMTTAGWEVLRYTRHGLQAIATVRAEVGEAIERATARRH